MKAILEITNGEFSGRRFALRSPVRLSVGRTLKADYAIPHDPQLSSIHFELELEAAIACVRDRGSTNGTYVNGKRVAECQLQDGDHIRAGDTSFKIQLEGVTTQTAPLTTVVAMPQDSAGEIPSRVEPVPEHSPLTSAATGNHTNLLSEAMQPPGKPVDRQGKVSLPKSYETAFHDESLEVMRKALEAAAWTKQAWLLDYCRQQSQSPEQRMLACYEMLAILGEPCDISSIHSLVVNPALGSNRMRLAGMYGHPGLLAFLLKNLNSSDERTAVEAGLAFQKIAGVEIESDVRVMLPPADGSQPDDFDAEFLDEAKLPDIDRARTFLQDHGERLNSSARWSRGMNVEGPLSRDVFMTLDLESRWEAALRGVYRGELRLGPAQLLKMRPLLTSTG